MINVAELLTSDEQRYRAMGLGREKDDKTRIVARMTDDKTRLVVPEDRMAGRVYHSAQRCLTKGNSLRNTLRLSNRSHFPHPESGVTLRRVLLHPSHIGRLEGSMRLILPNYLRVRAQGSLVPHSDCR